MTKRVQIYGVATGTMSGLTGLSREVIVDTTKNTLVVHDGVTVGGTELAKKDATNLDAATGANAGAMSAADKTKLDSLVASAWTETATAATARTALGLGTAAVEALAGSVVDDGSGNLTHVEKLNAQTGANYAIAASDRNKFVTRTNAAMADTIPSGTTLGNGWWADFKNIHASVIASITPVSGLIDGQSSITVGPGKTVRLVSNGTDINVLRSGAIINVSYATDSAVASGATTTPLDDTKPQNTEGTEFMSVTHTPSSIATALIVDVEALAASSAADDVVMALHQDSIADALRASAQNFAAGGAFFPMHMRHKFVPATVSQITLKTRIGKATAGTITFNGTGGTNRTLGGVAASSMTVWEVIP